MKTIDILEKIENTVLKLNYARYANDVAVKYFENLKPNAETMSNIEANYEQIRGLLDINLDYIHSTRESLEKLVADLSEKGAGQ